ncbi:MAG: recombinase family protein [Bdellovibrionota bacterium]
MKTDNRAIAFLRVSSKRQQDNSSHEIQRNECNDYCDKNNLILTKIFAVVESAKDSDSRTQFKEAIAFAKSNGIKHMLFYMFDRETRNLTDNENNEKLIRLGSLIIHYVKDRKVMDANSPDSDFLQRDMSAIVNKQFSRNLSTKVRDAMRDKAENGWAPGNHVPLGYVHEKKRDENGRELKRGTTIVRDTNEQNLTWIRREFELRALGYSYEKIREQVVQEGLVPQKKIKAYRDTSVQKRLSNRFYWGEFTWAGVRYQGKHPIIIPIAMLEKVDQLFTKRGTSSTKYASEQQFANGYFKCGDPTCGCFIIYDPKDKKRKNSEPKRYKYYRCSNGKRKHQSLRGRNVNEEMIWQQLESSLDSVYLSNDIAEAISAAMNEVKKKTKQSHTREIEEYRRYLEELEVREDSLYSDMKRELLSQESYSRQIKSVREERAHYTDLLEKTQHIISDASIETAKSVIELAKGLKPKWKVMTPPERLQTLNFIVSNPVLDGVNVRYDLKEPYSVLRDLRGNSNWRPQAVILRTINCGEGIPRPVEKGQGNQGRAGT